MRRLGHELGFEAMSLYRHVANKDDLLHGMLDLVLAEWQLPDGEGDWAECPGQRALGARRSAPPPVGGATADERVGFRPRGSATWTRSSAGSAARGSMPTDVPLLPPARRVHLRVHALGDRLHDERGRRGARVGADAGDPWAEYRHLAEHRDQHLTEGPHREVSAFEVGLDLILDGLQQTLVSAQS